MAFDHMREYLPMVPIPGDPLPPMADAAHCRLGITPAFVFAGRHPLL